MEHLGLLRLESDLIVATTYECFSKLWTSDVTDLHVNLKTVDLKNVDLKNVGRTWAERYRLFLKTVDLRNGQNVTDLHRLF